MFELDRTGTALNLLRKRADGELLGFWASLLDETGPPLAWSAVFSRYVDEVLTARTVQPSSGLSARWACWEYRDQDSLSAVLTGFAPGPPPAGFPRNLGPDDPRCTQDAQNDSSHLGPRKLQSLADGAALLKVGLRGDALLLPLRRRDSRIGFVCGYLQHPLTAAAKRNKKRIALETQRFAFLLEMALSRKMAHLRTYIRTAFSTAYGQLGSDRSYADCLEQALQASLDRLLDDTDATAAQLQSPPDLRLFSEAGDSNTAEDAIEATMLRWGESERDQGTVDLLGTRTGYAFSYVENALLSEAATVYSKYAAQYAASHEIDDRRKKIGRLRELLEVAQEVGESLLSQSQPEQIAEALISGVRKVMRLKYSLVLLAEDKSLSQSSWFGTASPSNPASSDFDAIPASCPYDPETWSLETCADCRICNHFADVVRLQRKPVTIPLDRVENNGGPYSLPWLKKQAQCGLGVPLLSRGELTGVLIAAGLPEADLTEEEELFLALTTSNASLALYNVTLMERSQDLAREDARGEVARDVLHTLTPTAETLRIYLDLMRKRLQRIASDPGDRINVRNHANSVQESLEALEDLRRQQQNLFQPYSAFTSPKDLPDEDIDLHSVLDDLEKLTAFSANQKKVRVQRKTHGTPHTIRANEQDVYLIFWNILHNAIKFTRGTRRTTISIYDAYDDSVAFISIRDEGVGIPAQYRSRIWHDGFSRPAPGHKRKTSGRGLHTVHQLLERIGGSAEVSSDDRGTEFAIRIPITTKPNRRFA